MIQDIRKGKSVDGAVGYASEKPGAQRLNCGTVAGRNRREIRAEMAVARRMRPGLKNACLHVSLSLPPEERLTDAQWEQIATEYMKRQGFEDAPWAVWRHTDAGHDHIHLVAARVNMRTGATISDSRDYRRGAQYCQEVEDRLNLTRGAQLPGQARHRAPGHGETRTGESDRLEIRQKVAAAAAASSTMTEFSQALERSGVLVSFNTASTGRISGMSYCKIGGDWMKASSISKDATFNGIKKAGVVFDPDQDQTAIQDRARALEQYQENRIAPEREPDPDVNGCELPDFKNLTRADKEAYKRQLMQKLLGADADPKIWGVKWVDQGGNSITFRDGGRLQLQGSTLTATDMPDKLAAARMVAAAKAAGWRNAQFSGPDGFVKAAAVRALKEGIEPSAKDPRQQKIIDQVRKRFEQQRPQVQASPEPAPAKKPAPDPAPQKPRPLRPRDLEQLRGDMEAMERLARERVLGPDYDRARTGYELAAARLRGLRSDYSQAKARVEAHPLYGAGKIKTMFASAESRAAYAALVHEQHRIGRKGKAAKNEASELNAEADREQGREWKAADKIAQEQERIKKQVDEYHKAKAAAKAGPDLGPDQDNDQDRGPRPRM